MDNNIKYVTENAYKFMYFTRDKWIK